MFFKIILIVFLFEISNKISAQNSEIIWFDAVQNNCLDKMKQLVDSGFINIDAKDQLGYAAIHYAVLNQNIKMVEWFCDINSNINIINNAGVTPLMIAILKENENLVSLLLNCNANPNSKDTNGLSPLHYAMYQNNFKIIQLLLDYGANPFEIDVYGNTPLHHLCTQNKIYFISLLKKYYQNFHVLNFHNQTPFILAIESQNIELVKYILDQKPIVDSLPYINKIIFTVLNTCNAELINLVLSNISQIPHIPKDTAHNLWKHCLQNDNKNFAPSIFRKLKIKRPLSPILTNLTLDYGFISNLSDILLIHGISVFENNFKTYASIALCSRYWQIRDYYVIAPDTLFLLTEYRAALSLALSKMFEIFSLQLNHNFKIYLAPGVRYSVSYASFSGLNKKYIKSNLKAQLTLLVRNPKISLGLGYLYWKYGGILQKPHHLNIFVNINLYKFNFL